MADIFLNMYIFIAFISISNIFIVKALTGCGHPDPDIGYYVINGTDARLLAWPWQAYIQSRPDRAPASFVYCGGSIINESYILTAAHCVADFEGKEPYKVYVYLGKHNLTNMHEPTQVNRTGVHVIMHEKYNRTYTQNDVALIKLNESLDFKVAHKQLQPVCLPKIDYPIIKDNCVSIGWGRIKEERVYPKVLQQIRLPLLNDSYCNKEFMKDLNYNLHPGSKLCAGYDEGGKGMCHGDSGGPLMCPIENGTWIQYGIVSYHFNLCASKGWPEVFTRVPYFYDWIIKHMV